MVLLLERTDHIGGLPANGLGATGGLFLEFINRIYNHYITTYGEDSQQVEDNENGCLPEPSVAEMKFKNMLSKHSNMDVLRMRQFDAEQRYITMYNGSIMEISILNREA